MGKKRILGLILAVVMMLVAMPIQATQAGVAKISQKKATIYVGETIDLWVNGTSKAVTWSTSSKKVAKVNQDGVVKGVKKGTAVITASVGSKELTCKVTVKAVGLSKKSVKLKVGDTYQLELNGVDAVFYHSNNEKIVNVSSRGLITAVGAGKTTVEVATAKGTYSCTVTVAKTKVKISAGYQKLLDFLKSDGVVSSTGEYAYVWRPVDDGMIFMITNLIEDNEVVFYTSGNSGSYSYYEFYLWVEVNLANTKTCTVRGSMGDTIMFKATIDTASYKGGLIPFDFLKAPSYATKSAKDAWAESLSSITDSLLGVVGAEIELQAGIKMSELGFNKVYDH